MTTRPHKPTLFPYTTLFRSPEIGVGGAVPPPAPLRRLHRPHPFQGGAGEIRIARDAQGFRSRDEEISERVDRKSTRLNSSHMSISYAVFCLKKKNIC